MSEHADFLARYGLESHRKAMMKSPEGRDSIARTINNKYNPSPTDNSHYSDDILYSAIAHKNKTGSIADADVMSVRRIIPKMSDEGKDSIIDHNLHRSSIGMSLAEHGNDRHRSHLIDHPDHQVRAAVAKFGNDAHRHELVNDDSEYVRTAVAKNGNDAHREKLVDDPYPMVRNTIAEVGNDEHRNKVYEYAKKYPKHYGRTLDAVAKKGTSEQRDEILNHSSATTPPFLDALHSIRSHPESTEEQKNKASELFKQMDDK